MSLADAQLRLRRKRFDKLFAWVCMGAAASSIVILIVLLVSIFVQGMPRLTWSFVTSAPSRNAEESGIFPAMVGSVFIAAVCAAAAIPIGIGTAILMQEYRPRHPLLRKLHALVELNITNLAGVPSVVYGILGLSVFVEMFGLFGGYLNPHIEFGARFHDVVVDAGGNRVFFDVPDRNAPQIVIQPGITGVAVNGDPVKLELLPEAEVQSRREAAKLHTRQSLDPLRASLLQGIEADVAAKHDDPVLQVARRLAAAMVQRVQATGKFEAWALADALNDQSASIHDWVDQQADTVGEAVASKVAVAGRAASLLTEEQAEELGKRSALRRIRTAAHRAAGSQVAGSVGHIAAMSADALTEYAEQEGWVDKARLPQLAELAQKQAAEVARALDLYGAEKIRAQAAASLDLVGESLATHQIRGLLQADQLPTPQRNSTKAWYYVRLPFGRGVLAGGLTLMLVVLPVIIISTQEALRAVPNSLRQGALAMGCTQWQMVSRMTLPAAIPGIMTGSILAMSRAIGEAAPVLIIAGIVYLNFTPQHLMDDFTAMPMQIYDWAGRPQAEFHEVAASGIIVLLAVLLTFNGLAIFIRNRYQKPLQ